MNYPLSAGECALAGYELALQRLIQVIIGLRRQDEKSTTASVLEETVQAMFANPIGQNEINNKLAKIIEERTMEAVAAQVKATIQ